MSQFSTISMHDSHVHLHLLVSVDIVMSYTENVAIVQHFKKSKRELEMVKN